MALRGDAAVKLTHRTAAEIAWILIALVFIERGIDRFKVFVRNQCFPAHDKVSRIIDFLRNPSEHARVAGDDFSDLSVSAGGRLYKLALLVSQHDRQTVELPREHAPAVSEKRGELLDVLGFVERFHRKRMPDFRQCAHDLVADLLRRTRGQNDPALLFKPLQLIIKSIIFIVGHDLFAGLVISVASLIQCFDQFGHSGFYIIHALVLRPSLVLPASQKAAFLPPSQN